MRGVHNDANSETKNRLGLAVVDQDSEIHVRIRGMLDTLPSYCLVGSFRTYESATAQIFSSKAAVALVGARPRERFSGIKCARGLRHLYPELLTIVVSISGDPSIHALALESDADGCLIEPFSCSQLVATIAFASSRRRAVPSLKSTYSDLFDNQISSRNQVLTLRERSVMRLIAKGFLYKEIANQLDLSEYVVHKLLTTTFRKLGARNRTEALLKVVRVDQ